MKPPPAKTLTIRNVRVRVYRCADGLYLSRRADFDAYASRVRRERAALRTQFALIMDYDERQQNY